jgi:hypothetical protein
LLGNADRVMQRQHRDGRSQTDMAGSRRDIGEHQIGTGKHTQSAEVMLADSGGMETHLLGLNRLVGDVGYEVAGAPGVVFVVIVAQLEIAEFHSVPPSSRLRYAMLAPARALDRLRRRRLPAQVSAVRSAVIDGTKR